MHGDDETPFNNNYPYFHELNIKKKLATRVGNSPYL